MESYEDTDLGDGMKGKRRKQLNQPRANPAPEPKPPEEPTFESPPPEVLPCHNS